MFLFEKQQNKYLQCGKEKHEFNFDEPKKKAKKKYKFKADKHNPLKILPLHVSTNPFQKNALQEQNLIPHHPFLLVASGATGSGKSVAVGNLFTNDKMLKGFFDEIWLFSPSPDLMLVENLGLNDERVVMKSDQNSITKLKEIINRQKQLHDQYEGDLTKFKKVCIIFEDLTSRKKLMNSPEFASSIVFSRHCNISVVAIVHKYKALIRVARLNMNHYFIFPTSNDEIKQIIDDQMIPPLTKKSMEKLIAYAFKKDETHSHPFLYINKKGNPKQRFRKSLDVVLEI